MRIEYVEAMAPPSTTAGAQHDDWISSVAGLAGTRLAATGCFNKNGYVWTLDGKLQSTLEGHTGPVRSVAWGRGLNAAQKPTVYTASQDETLRMWTLGDEGKTASW